MTQWIEPAQMSRDDAAHKHFASRSPVTSATHGYAIGITVPPVLYDLTYDGFKTAPR